MLNRRRRTRGPVEHPRYRQFMNANGPFPGSAGDSGVPEPLQREASPKDHRRTQILQLCTFAVTFLFGFQSMFGMMATDACSTPGRCHLGVFALAYVVGWGGALTSLIIVIFGPSRALKRGEPMWPKALLGALVLAGSIASWVFLGMVAIPV